MGSVGCVLSTPGSTYHLKASETQYFSVVLNLIVQRVQIPPQSQKNVEALLLGIELRSLLSWTNTFSSAPSRQPNQCATLK